MESRKRLCGPVHPRLHWKSIKKFGHIRTRKPVHSPSKSNPPSYTTNPQQETDDSPFLNDTGKKRIQRIVGSLLFYARALDCTLLHALNVLAAEQAKSTEKTKAAAEYLLDYVATHPNATVRYRKSSMVLWVISDAAYLTEPNAWSRAGGHFFWENSMIMPHPQQ